MKRVLSRLLILPMMGLVVAAAGAAAVPATANAQTAPQPAYTGPLVWLSSPVTSMLVDKGKSVTFEIDVNNKSTAGKFVNLELTKAPEGWNPILKDRGFIVRSVYVRPDGLESVDLQVQVPADAKGDYEFNVRATGDGFDPSLLKLMVGIKDQATQSSSFVVQYPTLQGKSGSTFGFKADLKNDSEADKTYGLSAKAPDGWTVVFKPSYQDTQISSVQVKTGSSQSLDINVTPPARVAAGDYPITVTASSASERATADLKVTVTGDYQMAMSTRSDLFNTQATAGQESPFYITITNSGSAPLQNVSLSSSKPQGWTVTFKPDKIDQLDPGAQREVAMMIKPGSNAIAGDYMLTVTASHPQVSLSRDIRVTVQTPTLWGFVGIAVLVVVIGGLLGLFMKLGRR